MLGGYGGVLFVVDGSYAFFGSVVGDIQFILASGLLDSGMWMEGVVSS